MKKCFVCGSVKFKKYITTNDSLFRFRDFLTDYILYKCTKCELVFDPSPKRVPALVYSKEYYQNPYFTNAECSIQTFISRIEGLLAKTGKNVSLLDVGCGLGVFLELAKKAGVKKVMGVEISNFAIKECKKKGLSVYRKFPKGNFDIVTLQDSIEHFTNPIDELQKVYKVLKPGGLLLVITPDTASLSKKVLGRFWFHWKKDEHLSYFNPKNIRIFLEKNGFEIIKIQPAKQYLTLRYVLERAKSRLPQSIWKTVMMLTNSKIFNLVFPVTIGEMEVWARKR